MHRLIAILLGFALVAAQSPAARLHIHLYTDHDHPEHHHGPAAHEHIAQWHAADYDVVIETCHDTGRHAVSLARGSATMPHLDAWFAVECNTPYVAEPDLPARVASPILDVRAHGPPLQTQAPPRAPPLISHL